MLDSVPGLSEPPEMDELAMSIKPAYETEFNSPHQRQFVPNDCLFHEHRAADLQDISVRIESSPLCNRLPFPDLGVLYFIGFQRETEGGIVGKVALGYD